MTEEAEVSTVDEWLRLPELDLPTLEGIHEDGMVRRVHKVGFLVVPRDECDRRNVQGTPVPRGKYILPTAVVELGGVATACRLPSDLAAWARYCVQMAQSCMDPFPCNVEFGRVKGRAYAEIL